VAGFNAPLRGRFYVPHDSEILHGIARGILLVPHVGEFRSNQVGVFIGSLIILVYSGPKKLDHDFRSKSW
jgi:hypothetical protein